MENVPTNMRTGLLDTEQQLPPEFVKRIYSILATVGVLSIKTSIEYAEHAGRNYITKTDTKYAWMHLARTFLDRENLEQEIQDTEHEVFDRADKCVVCETILPEEYFECDDDCGRYYCSETCAEADENHECDGEETEEEEEDETEKVFVRSTCECSQCTDIHTHVDTWEQWEPRDEVEAFIKRNFVEEFFAQVEREKL